MKPSPNKKTLHVGGPNVGDRQVFDRLVDEIFERRWFTNGGVVEQEFESKLCAYLNVKHCIPVCNATIGLQLACHAMELDGQVILPAFTFVATPHAVQWERLQPVFADVDPLTHTLCPDSVESLITPKTSAIIGVHVWGNPCQTERLEQIAARNNIPIFYDAAHAFGCSHMGKMIGNFGRCEVFSFHATKFFNTFEGGAIATNDDDLAKKIRLMKNFGFAGMDHVIHLGTNAKMTEICAAMGISLFARLDELLEINQARYLQYRKRLDGIPGLTVFSYDQQEKTNWQYIVLQIDESEFGESRDQVFERLLQNDIRARRYFHPGCHNMEPYKSARSSPDKKQTPNHPDPNLRNTDRLCQTILCLPTGGSLSESDVDRVCETIKIGQQSKSPRTQPHFRFSQTSGRKITDEIKIEDAGTGPK